MRRVHRRHQIPVLNGHHHELSTLIGFADRGKDRMRSCPSRRCGGEWHWPFREGLARAGWMVIGAAGTTGAAAEGVGPVSKRGRLLVAGTIGVSALLACGGDDDDDSASLVESAASVPATESVSDAPPP